MAALSAAEKQSVNNGDRQEPINGLLTMKETGAREMIGRVEKLLSSLPSVSSSLYFSLYPASARCFPSLQSRRDTRPLSHCMGISDEIEILGLKRRKKNTFKIVSSKSFRDHSVNGCCHRG